jgi:hypothetical protein
MRSLFGGEIGIRYAVVSTADGVVVDVVMRDVAPTDTEAVTYVASDTANIGDDYEPATGAFSTPTVPVSLEELRQELRTELAEYLRYAEAMGFVYDGKWFASDNNSQIKLLAVLMSASMDPQFTTVFKTLDQGYVTLDAVGIAMLCNAAKQYIAACYQRDSEHTATITAAATVEELHALDFSGGWPNGPIDLGQPPPHSMNA